MSNRSKLTLMGVFILGALYGGILLTIIHTGTSAGNPVRASAAASALPVRTVDAHREFTYDNALVRLNEARLSAGLRTLATDPYLSSRAAESLGDNCPVTGHGTFRKAHSDGAFKGYGQVGEVLESGSTTPLEAVTDLLASPTHRDIVLDGRYTVMGIGIATSPVNCLSVIFGY